MHVGKGKQCVLNQQDKKKKKATKKKGKKSYSY